MKSVLLAFSMILATAGFVAAQQGQYVNPYGSQQRPEPELRYNPFSSEWSYEKPRETLQYNPHESEWEYADPEAQPLFNPFSGKWELE